MASENAFSSSDDASFHSFPGAALWQRGGAATRQIEIGHRFMMAGCYERAVHYFRAAITLEAHNADAHARLAIALLELGEIAEADAVSVLALAMWPDATPILQVRGAVLRALGRLEEGREILQRIALENPNAGALCGFWGGALYEDGRFTEAGEAARTSLRCNPEDWRALLLLILCLVAQPPVALPLTPQCNEIADLMTRALQMAPGEAMTHAVLGSCYAQSGEPDTARYFLNNALQIEAANALALHWIRVLDNARSHAN